MSVWERNLHDFITEAASDSPTPGGGSVAALTAALGASMGAMVGNLTKGKKYAHLESEMFTFVDGMSVVIDESKKLLDADIAAFQQYMSALKLPKETDEQKANRQQAIYKATVQSTEAPLQLIRLCRSALALIAPIVTHANKNVISDLAIGALLLECAAQSARLTIEINLPALESSDEQNRYKTDTAALIAEIVRLKTDIVDTVRQTLHFS